MGNEFKTRDMIDEKDKWDLKSMIASEEEFAHLSKQTEDLLKQLCKMKGHILDNEETLATYLKISEQYDRMISKLYVYAQMNCDTNTKDVKKQAMKLKAVKLYETGIEQLSFVVPEILKSDYQQIEMLLKKANLEKYQFYFEKLFRNQSHTLSEQEEQVISQASIAFGVGDDVFYNLENADAKFGSILDENNQEVELTSSNYLRFMQSSNRRVRKDCFQKFYQFFEGHKNTLAASLKGTIKENFFFSNVRHFHNPLQMHLFADKIDGRVYDELIEKVHHYLPSLHDYLSIRKKMLQIDELHMYDLYCDVVKPKETKISFDAGKKIVKEALRPLGEQYVKDLELAFSKRWIDKYPNVGKKSGGYKWGCYDSFPYILLNYDETIDSVSTLAHELGHAMHSYYSNLHQDYVYHDYPIFLAEIASTVNEVLLDDYLYQHAKSKEEKILYLSHFLDKVRTTIYRQTMFAEFEKLMHDKESDGIPLTEEAFSNTYYQLNQMYYGKDVVSDEEIRYEWSRIPHFYTSFYVYQYATGLVSALSLASDIIHNVPLAKEKYLEFLSSGASDYPLEILKKAGVDITKAEPYEKAFEMFEQKLNELKQLVEGR